MAFAYYQRLTPRQRAIVRSSDAVRRIELPDVPGLLPLVTELELRLARAEPRGTARVAGRLLGGISTRLQVPVVDRVRVLSVRPSDATSELHGLYERDGEGQSQITVWMRTAAKARVVAFRTFLRTLLHELCHHLDYELLRLADSFHTEGFFSRESSLMRQLAPVLSLDDEGADESEASGQLELPW